MADPNILTRNRRMATGILLAMVAIWVGTHFFPGSGTLVMLIRSMAEAGMIGGIADWFAVEALFRHPLGIPIPHTALLPKNQSRAAQNVGRFFQDHFLEPGQLRQKILDLKPAGIVHSWLTKRENALRVANHISDLVATLTRIELSDKAQQKLFDWLRDQARNLGDDDDLSKVVKNLVKHGMRTGILDDILRIIGEALDENRAMAVDLVQERSRWWIASAVDRRLAEVVVNGVLSIIDELSIPGNKLRNDLESAFDAGIDTLEQDGALQQAIANVRETLIGSDDFDVLVGGIVSGVRDNMRSLLERENRALAGPIADMLVEIVENTLKSDEDKALFDDKIAELASDVIADFGPSIAAYISDTIANWEPQELNQRFESEIGPDLQFIRINGAVLGSVIGGLIFAASRLFEAMHG